jgi:phosphatidylinositol-bisphosphatase
MEIDRQRQLADRKIYPLLSAGGSRVVLLGDLNYRIAMDDGEARQLVRARKWSMLLENDELLLELSAGRRFHGWSEGVVTFAPTYKYHRNSDKLYWCADTGHRRRQRQHRAPAWYGGLAVSTSVLYCHPD